jgi:hypothetical protein
MRFWVSGPRILGHRTGVSFGPSDFRRLKNAQTARGSTAPGKPRTSAWIYVVRASNGHVKVGITADPLARLASLQTGSSQKLELVYTCVVQSNEGFAVEQAAHNTLWKHRLEGEWFDTSPDMAVAAIAAASYRLNDPIVEIQKDKIALVLEIAARTEDGAHAAPAKRRIWHVWFWTTAPILALIGIIYATGGGAPTVNLIYWMVNSFLISIITYCLIFLFARFRRSSS